MCRCAFDYVDLYRDRLICVYTVCNGDERGKIAMVNRYTLGGAIFSVFLLAIFGIQGAFSWLRQSPRADNSERIEAVNDRTDDNIVDSIRSTDNTRIDGNNSELPSNNDRSTNDSADLQPLETAGTYIQRQKRAERDTEVAQTDVDVIPVAAANNTPTPVQTDTRVDQPAVSQAPSPSRPAAATTTTTEAVPALW